MRQDVRHLEIGASLRGRRLYVKVPHDKTLILLEALRESKQDLLRKEVSWNPSSKHQPWVFSGPPQDWEEDLQTLENARSSFSRHGEVIYELCWALRLGLKGDPSVDWLGRAGKPSQPKQVFVRSEQEQPSRDLPPSQDDLLPEQGAPEGD